MTRITCQAIQTGDELTFIWSEGTASFEPYTLRGNEAARFRAAARTASEALQSFASAPTPSALAVAQAGHELFLSILPGDQGREIAQWLAERPKNEASLEVVSTSLTDVPWNVVYDMPPSDSDLRTAPSEALRGFWSCRYALGITRRVNPLRRYPILFQPRVLLAIDPVLRNNLPEAQRRRLVEFVDSKMPISECANNLFSELESQQPELVYLSCRTDGRRLIFADERFSLRDLAERLDLADETIPVVILNVVSESGATLPPDGVEEARLPGLVTFSSHGDGAASADLGLALLSGMLYDGQPVGRVLQSIRPSSPQAGLTAVAFCPPTLRVAWDETAAEPTEPEQPPPLPDVPYKPLAPFEREDRALLAGRDKDIARFCDLLDDRDTQVVLLHGPSGSGKSSFLRAGVLPFLEDECVGFLALRDRADEETAANERDYRFLAIRPGPDLLGQRAEAFVAFCARPFSYSTPTGATVTIDLPNILKTCVQGPAETAIRREAGADAGAPPPLPPAEIAGAELCAAFEQDATLLGRLLRAICERLPFELVIVVEQAEEVITQVRGAAGRDSRRRALGMLAAAVGSHPRCKIVFSIRTDFFGHFYDKLSPLPTGALREYLLPPLRQEQLSLALLLPTAGEPLPYSAEVPLEKYGFQFAEGLAENIANDVQKVARQQQQSALAVLHSVATLLYELVKDRPDRVIRAQDVPRIGGVEGAFAKFVEQRIKKLPMPYRSQRGLRELFPLFFTKQMDGTVYRNLVSAKEISEAWRGPTPIQEVVRAASADTAQILEVDQLLVGGSEELYVGLTQDSLARLGVEWEEEKKRRAFARSRVVDFLWIAVPATLLLIVITWALSRRMGADRAEVTPEDQKKEIERRAEEAVEAELNTLRWPLYAGQIQQAHRAWNDGNILRMRQLLLSQQAHTKESDTRGFEWYYLWRLANRQRHTLVGHTGSLTSAAMTPNGQLAASGSHDGSVKLWDTRTGEVKATLHAGGPVQCVALASDAKSVAAGTADGTISLWLVKEFKEYEVVEKADKTLKAHKGPVLALAFAPDNQTLLSGGDDQTTFLWDVAKAEVRQPLKGHTGAVHAVAFAANGKAMASGASDQQLIIWGADGKAVHNIKTGLAQVRAVAFAPDGKTLAAGGARTEFDLDTGAVRFWNVETGKDTGPTIRHGSEVLSLAFLDDKLLATAGKDNALKIWEVEKGGLNGTIRGHLGAIRSVAASGDGKTLVTASADNTIKVWDTAVASESNVLAAHKGGVHALALLFGDRFAASGGADGVVRFWDLANGNLVHSLPAQPGAVFALAAGPEGKTQVLATATWNDKDEGETKLWELQADDAKLTAKELHVLKGHKKAVTTLTFSAGGELLVSAGLDGNIILWDPTTGKEKATFTGHEGAVRCLSFLEDAYLISAGDEGKIRLWSIAKSRQIDVFTLILDKERKDSKTINFPLQGHSGAVTGLLYVPGAILSSSRDGSIKLWNLASGTDALTMRGHSQGVLAMAPGGSVLVTGGADQAVRLWDAGIGLERFALTGHTGPVRAVAATRDRTLILSGSADGTIRLWRAAPEPGGGPKKKE